jgi:hypothetical protein
MGRALWRQYRILVGVKNQDGNVDLMQEMVHFLVQAPKFIERSDRRIAVVDVGVLRSAVGEGFDAFVRKV